MSSLLDKNLRRAFAIFLLFAACAEANEPGEPAPVPINPVVPPQPQPMVLTKIHEDFNNSQLIADASNIILDVNEGFVRLPIVQFPDMFGDELRTYEMPAEQNGLISANQILVGPMGTLRASDSIELVARDFVRVTGQIHAGPGGVTISAGKSITVDGTIESEGPVLLRLADPYDGYISISGQIITLSADERSEPPKIELLGRGRIEIGGVLHTKSINTLNAGSITIASYGDVRIIGPAEITSSAGEGGGVGAINIRSEGRVEITTDASIGQIGRGIDPLTSTLGSAAEIEIQAQEVDIGDNASIIGFSALSAPGGSVSIVAGRTLRTGMGSILSGGTGSEGGDVVVHVQAGELGQGTYFGGGTGFALAGELQVYASSALSLAVETRLTGGDGFCADGGSTSVYVAGDLTLAEGSGISGGAGGVTPNQRPCMHQDYRGGNVEVVAHRVKGDDSGIRTGGGTVRAEPSVRIDPEHRVQMPNLTVQSSGWIVSRTIDRGSVAMGQLPVLRQLAPTSQPDMTSVRLELAGATAVVNPFDTWIEVTAEDPAALEPLRNARYFKYRLTLIGRAFDTPVVDLFEIDLAPARLRSK